MRDAAQRLKWIAEELTGVELPVRLRAWDGSEAGPPGGAVLVLRRRRALRHLLGSPGELGLARAWVAGDLDVEGDLYEGLARIAGIVWDAGIIWAEAAGTAGTAPGPASASARTEAPGAAGASRVRGALRTLRALRQPRARAAAAALVRLARPLPPPRPPREEIRARGRLHLHTQRTDRRAVTHHYDVGNDFYALVLGPSMVYSCAYWPGEPAEPAAPGDLAEPAEPGPTLEEAQRDKLELVCRKLGLRPGMRLLDVGCGWGSMAVHAAREHGVRVVGVTLSAEQAAYARRRVAKAGLADRVEIRVQDYRDVADGPYDAISSIGMAEHVGSVRYLAYARALYELLAPGGRLLNHQIGRRPQSAEEAYHVDRFIDAYVFPGGELAPLGTTVTLLERAGFEVRDVESLREHYGPTLRRWVSNLEAEWPRAVRLAGYGRARVWRLYMAACALAFEGNSIGVNQVLAVRTPQPGEPGTPGDSGLPLRARGWN
ncbi:class I SAM-dependent methyltransferase [Streptomyces sp. NA04227]|uniref:SAM-dependent methyltransferase n=1 Tax=Streptomyces sp. NA04227 TaxID=2742136 RepID=UPI0015927A21|nr:cyclopropane-fatty-acyl-phospholipid synthase family protein [Streptomyces sp. NA04227]QKW07019.1 class I SAM-dependent methyltransferase [Streptomyces sp. NA04227]